MIFLSGVQSATDAVTASESADSIVLPSAEWLENDEELYLSFTAQRDLQPGENPIYLDNIILKADKIDCGTEITDEMLPVVKTPSGEGYSAVPESACWAVYTNRAGHDGEIPADYFSPFTVSGSDSPVMVFDVISRGKYYYDMSQQLPAENVFIYNAKGAFDDGFADDDILSGTDWIFTTEGVTDPGPESTAQVICIPLKVDINHKSVIQEATGEALGLKGGPCSVCGEIEEDGMYLLKDTSPYKYPGGEIISDSGETRSLNAVSVAGDLSAEVIIQDPLGVIPDDAEISIDGIAADPGRYYDGDYNVEDALNVSVSLKDTQGNRIPGLFTDYVRILIEIPDDWDEDELKTLDVNIYDDLVFADRIEYRVYDADGNFIRTADKDYQPAEGETIKKFAAFWTDNLSDFAVMDTLTDEEDFGHYKEEAKETADGLAHDGDSEEIQALIKTAKDEIDALAYDESKTLDENKATVDAIVSKLENDIAEHRKKYTATFIADGKTVDEVTFTIDTDSITEPDVPIKEGYTGVWEEYTLGTEDIIVNAVYTPNEYTITYVIDGNETEVEYNFGASVDKPADPVKDGFNFIGWDEEIPDTMPAENLTITALFEVIPEPEEPTPTEPTPTEPTPTEPTPTEPTPTEPTPTEPTPTEPTPTEPTPTEPTPTEPTPTEPTPTDTEPAHEHDYKGEVTKEPTCTEDGIMTYTCECGETYTQAIPKTGHKPGAWTVVTPATTEAAGKEVKKCEVCGEVLAEREIAKLEPQETDAGIVGVNLEKLNDYGIANAFGVNPEKLPAGSTVTWYVNGEKAGEGNGFQVENPTEDYTIKAVVTNRDGKVIGETEEVTVKVNNSFFARLYYWLCRIIQKVIDLFKK